MNPETEKRIAENRRHHPEEHDHPEHPDHGQRDRAFGGLRAALWIALSLVAIEFLGAAISGSLALLADAFHILSDSLALGAALLASYLASRMRSKRHSYGYYRIEILTAFLNALLLLGVAGFIVKEAIHRWGSTYSVDGIWMISIGVLGLIANLLMLKVMHRGGLSNLNLRAAFLHVVGDTLSSIAVVVGAFGVFLFAQSWPDLAASLIVALILFVMAGKLLWEAANVLLEGTPSHLDPEQMQTALIQDFKEIKSIHDFHVWEITSHLFAMTAHLEVKLDNLKQSKDLLDRINYWVKTNYGIGHTTFQIEPIVDGLEVDDPNNH
jgi:cobalt-zinc-cadmium efflux system protein